MVDQFKFTQRTGQKTRHGTQWQVKSQYRSLTLVAGVLGGRGRLENRAGRFSTREDDGSHQYMPLTYHGVLRAKPIHKGPCVSQKSAREESAHAGRVQTVVNPGSDEFPRKLPPLQAEFVIHAWILQEIREPKKPSRNFVLHEAKARFQQFR